jgi:hypothetical protein
LPEPKHEWFFSAELKISLFFNKHGHLVLAPATGHTTRSNRTVAPTYTMVAHGPSEEVRWGRFSHLFMSPKPVPGKGTVHVVAM